MTVPHQPPPFPDWPAVALAAVGIAAATAVTAGAPALPLDDAYIHLTFAKNLASGHGFAFNPGEHSLGFTSPLWVMLLALLDVLGADPVAAARWAGMAGFGAIVALLYLVVARSLPEGRAGRVFAVLAGLAVAFSGNLAWLAGSGMETSLYLALSLLAILLLRPARPRPIVGGLILGLAVLARPTGLLLALILIATLALQKKFRAAALAAAASAVVASPWFLYSLATTGFILPPTRAGKLASNLANAGFSIKGASLFIWRHLVYFWKVDLDVLLLFLLGLGLSIQFLVRRLASRRAGHAHLLDLPASPAALLGIWAGLDLIMHAFLFRSTAFTTPMHYLRYSAMLIPATAALAALGAGRLAAPSSRRNRAFLVTLLAIPILLGCARHPAWHRLYLAHADQLAAEHRAAADYIRHNLPTNARVACLDIGMLGYYSGRHVLDLGGLTDPSILPLLSKAAVGPWLIEQHATHYLEMVRHDSERIVGVRADDGKRYRLVPVRSFHVPPYSAPLLLHSLGMNLYLIKPL